MILFNNGSIISTFTKIHLMIETRNQFVDDLDGDD